MRTRTIGVKFAVALALIAAPLTAMAQDGVSTAGAARASYLSTLNMIPKSREIAVEDFINYHRHDIGRPTDGMAVGLDVRWTKDTSSEGSVFLQVGLSTALLSERKDRKPINLALVIDKSGSMNAGDKMSRVKAALQTLVTKLNETDVLSIVVYDSGARVVLPATNVTNKDKISQLIRGITAGGSTNIDSGLTLGYAEALKHYKSGANNRVILLTDGIANQGVTDPDKIAAGSAVFNKQGIDLTTIGVGRDLNHDLLDTLATTGRGLFHFVADAKDIEKVFDKEVQSLLSLVARRPKLDIFFNSSAELNEIYGYDPEYYENKVTINFDNLNSGATQIVLARVTPNLDYRRIKVRVTLSYEDVARNKRMSVDNDLEATVEEINHTDSSLKKNITIAKLAQSIHDMAKSFEGGDTQEARRTIRASLNDTRSAYPIMQDVDIKRTYSTAARYEQTLMKEELKFEPIEYMPVKSSPNPLPNGSFIIGNSGFSSALRYSPPGKNCLWQMGYTIAPKWNDPLLHRLHITSQEFLAPKRPTGKEQVFFANAGGTESLVLFTCIVGLKPHTKYKISFQSVSLNAGREWIPTYEIRVGGERSQPQPAGYGRYAETSMIWNSGPTSSATLSIVRMPIPHGGGLIAIANIEMVEIV